MTKIIRSIIIDSYEDLYRFAAAFATRKLNLLIVIGRPGVAKSETIRAALPDNACWIEGNATAFGIYEKLFENRGELVVIDDVDSIYADKSAVRLLKSLCNSRPTKQLSWNSRAAGDRIPREFETTSHTCIIANDWRELDANVEALMDRGQLIRFDPTAEEVHRKTAEWFRDEEVYLWFGDHLDYFPTLSMRDYVKCAELKNAGFRWREMMLGHVPQNIRVMIDVLADSTLSTEDDRANRFRERTGASRATYFNTKKKINLHRTHAV